MSMNANEQILIPNTEGNNISEEQIYAKYAIEYIAKLKSQLPKEPKKLNYYEQRKLGWNELISYNKEWSRYHHALREVRDEEVKLECPLFFENVRSLVKRKMHEYESKDEDGYYIWNPIKSLGECAGVIKKGEYGMSDHPSNMQVRFEQLDLIEVDPEYALEALGNIYSEWIKVCDDSEKKLKAQESRRRREFIKSGGKISIAEAMKQSGVEPTEYKPLIEVEKISIAEAIRKYGVREAVFN